jgi:hypothetical protein
MKSIPSTGSTSSNSSSTSRRMGPQDLPSMEDDVISSSMNLSSLSLERIYRFPLASCQSGHPSVRMTPSQRLNRRRQVLDVIDSALEIMDEAIFVLDRKTTQ